MINLRLCVLSSRICQCPGSSYKLHGPVQDRIMRVVHLAR